MRRTFSLLLLTTPALLLAGCITHYQYLSRGEVATGEGDTRRAVLYWHREEGRLWYGKPYAQLETDLTLRVCRQLPKPFERNTAGYLVLRSKAGDRRVARLAADGELQALEPARRLSEGDHCGVIRAGGVNVDTTGLPVGIRPTVTVYCENPLRPDRYPAVASYTFQPITRVEIGASRSAPDPCLATTTGPPEPAGADEHAK